VRELARISERTDIWGFCLSRLADGPGRTLDFGADVGFLSLAAAQRGQDVVALDRIPPALPYRHPRARRCPRTSWTAPSATNDRFDQILKLLVDRARRAGRPLRQLGRADGDLDADGDPPELLAPGGRMILTIPVGRDQICGPYHRIYGEDRLLACSMASASRTSNSG